VQSAKLIQQNEQISHLGFLLLNSSKQLYGQHKVLRSPRVLGNYHLLTKTCLKQKIIWSGMRYQS